MITIELSEHDAHQLLRLVQRANTNGRLNDLASQIRQGIEVDSVIHHLKGHIKWGHTNP